MVEVYTERPGLRGSEYKGQFTMEIMLVRKRSQPIESESPTH